MRKWPHWRESLRSFTLWLLRFSTFNLFCYWEYNYGTSAFRQFILIPCALVNAVYIWSICIQADLYLWPSILDPGTRKILQLEREERIKRADNRTQQQRFLITIKILFYVLLLEAIVTYYFIYPDFTPAQKFIFKQAIYIFFILVAHFFHIHRFEYFPRWFRKEGYTPKQLRKILWEWPTNFIACVQILFYAFLCLIKSPVKYVFLTYFIGFWIILDFIVLLWVGISLLFRWLLSKEQIYVFTPAQFRKIFLVWPAYFIVGIQILFSIYLWSIGAITTLYTFFGVCIVFWGVLFIIIDILAAIQRVFRRLLSRKKIYIFTPIQRRIFLWPISFIACAQILFYIFLYCTGNTELSDWVFILSLDFWFALSFIILFLAIVIRFFRFCAQIINRRLSKRTIRRRERLAKKNRK